MYWRKVIKELTIHLIMSKGCKDCTDMKETLFQAIEQSSASEQYELHELSDESNEAIDLAIENDINDLPACIIGSQVFVGKDYTYAKMLDAIEEAWDNLL